MIGKLVDQKQKNLFNPLLTGLKKWYMNWYYWQMKLNGNISSRNYLVATELVIRHFKSQFKLGENYLSASIRPKMNSFLRAAAWNLKKLMEQFTENGMKLSVALLQKILFIQNFT